MLGGAHEGSAGSHVSASQLVSMQLTSFRTPQAVIEWLETNSETNWLRKHAATGEQTYRS
jgi:hypothetical protein